MTKVESKKATWNDLEHTSSSFRNFWRVISMFGTTRSIKRCFEINPRALALRLVVGDMWEYHQKYEIFLGRRPRLYGFGL